MGVLQLTKTDTTHQDEDVNQVSQPLLQELEQKLDLPEGDASSASEKIQKLKRLVIFYKKKYEQTLHAKQALESAEEENQALREQHKVLKGHFDSVQEENKQSKLKAGGLNAQNASGDVLQAEVETLKQQAKEAASATDEFNLQYKEVQGQNLQYKQKVHKLVQVIQEKDKRIAELQQFEYSAKLSNEQKQELESLLTKEREVLDLLKQKSEQAIQDLAESNKRGEQFERVIQFLRERSQEAHLETNQLHEEYQGSQEAVLSLNKQNKEMAEKLEGLKTSLQLEENAKTEALEELLALQGQLKQLKKLIATYQEEKEQQGQSSKSTLKNFELVSQEKQKLENLLKEKNDAFDFVSKEIDLIKQTLVRGLREAKDLESRYLEAVNEKMVLSNKYQQIQEQLAEAMHREQAAKTAVDYQLKEQLNQKQSAIEELNRQLTFLGNEKQQILDNLTAQKNQYADYEARLKMAQQHLAKKVKETALMNGQLEEQKALNIDLQNLAAQFQAKASDLQNTLEVQLQQEKKLQEQLTKWEEKYFHLYDRWEDTEARNKELKKLEERHHQLQNLLNNLGSVMGAPMGYAQPAGMIANWEKAEKPAADLFVGESQSKDGASDGAIEIIRKEDIIELPKKDNTLFDKPPPPERYKKNLFD